eukprot:scaffold106349_cov35-Prasinocladus_malaysianus.AAC.1
MDVAVLRAGCQALAARVPRQGRYLRCVAEQNPGDGIGYALRSHSPQAYSGVLGARCKRNAIRVPGDRFD